MTDQDVLDHVRGVEKRTRRQKHLLTLANAVRRSADDTATLHVLLEAERTVIQARRASAAARKPIAKQGRVERRDRTRELIGYGGLVALAGLRDHDTAVIVGALLEVTTAPDDVRERWRASGSALMAQRQAETEARRVARADAKKGAKDKAARSAL